MKEVYIVTNYYKDTRLVAAFKSETDAFEYIMAAYEEDLLNEVNDRTTHFEYSEKDVKKFLKVVVCNYKINKMEIQEE